MSNAGNISRKTSKNGVGGFLFFTVLMLAAAAGMAYYFKAPYLSPYIEDWQAWAATDLTNAGLMLISLAFAAFGVLGAILRLLTSRHPEEIPHESDLYLSDDNHGEANMAPAQTIALGPVQKPEPRLVLRPSSEDAINPETREIRDTPAKPTLMFDANSLPSGLSSVQTNAPAALASPMHQPVEIQAQEVLAQEVLAQEVQALEMQSLEPAVFAQTPADAETSTDIAIDNVVPIRPDMVVLSEMAAPKEVTSETPAEASIEVQGTDPLAAALLADTAELPPQTAPQSDINAVISSAMRFIDNQDATGFASDAPVSSLVETAISEQLPVVEALPVLSAATETPVETSVELTEVAAPMAIATPEGALHTDLANLDIPSPIEPASAMDSVTPEPAPAVMTAWVEANTLDVPSAENEIKQATATALSVWPDQVRAIAADELRKRIALLHTDSAPACQRAFSLIAAGELNAAAMTLHSHADSLAQAGALAAAADIWRAYGALHMGRDDAKAMMAYEKVSELDRNDANIHLYLVRRYQMSGENEKLAPVLERALRVVSDESTRFDLLGPFADAKLKSGDLHSASQALEELSRLNQARVIKEPENVSAKSAYGISLAKLAQTREMMGITQMAGPLYKMAHEVFADLSNKIPTHTGLRSMADNALKDAERLNFA